jgi:hypothetical protein
MKKVLFTLGLVAFALSAQAQYQLTNPGFDGTWSSIQPYTGGGSTNVGTTPNGWCVANVAGYKFMVWIGSTTVGTADTDRTGVTNGHSCKLQNVEYMNNVIPGYITLGTSWNTADTGGGNSDGGSFGGASFTGTPDAIEFYYKRTAADNSQPASVVAYMWKGHSKQTNVPVSIGSSPTKKDMIDRDRNVLGMSYSLPTGDSNKPTYYDNFSLIASLMTGDEHIVRLTEEKSDWTKATYEFTYHNATDKPTMINVVFGAMDYFTDRSNHKKDNTLTVDDVKFLYYSELASCSYNGAAVTFNAGAATIDEFYDASKLSVTSNGHGATIEKSMNEATQKLTITVKGEDISENESNYHTYTIQFKDAALSDLSYNGATLSGFSESVTSYDLSSVLYDEAKLSYTVKGSATAVKSYNAETGLLTITVTGATSVTEYTIQFKVKTGPEVVSTKTYTEDLYVTLGLNTADKQPADVQVETLENDNINFMLKNFVLVVGEEIMPIGNIAVENIEVASDNTFSFNDGIELAEGDDPVYAGLWFGPTVNVLCGGSVPLNMTGKFIGNDHIVVYISIKIADIMGYDVEVHLGYDAAPMAVNAIAQYGTFCAPFAVDVPEGVQAYTVLSETGGLLNLTPVTGTIPANTPVILYAENGYVTYVTEEECNPIYTFGIAEEGTPVAGLLTGVYENTLAPVGSYVLQNLNDKVGFYQVATGQQPTVKANRCYLTTTSGVKAFFFNEDDATSINEELRVKNEEFASIFNLAGQRLSKMQKGINIVNGKKILK